MGADRKFTDPGERPIHRFWRIHDMTVADFMLEIRDLAIRVDAETDAAAQQIVAEKLGETSIKNTAST